MLPELLVTDFAGTTLADEGAVVRAYRRAMSEFGIPVDDAEIASRRGASKRAVFQEFVARVESGPAAAVRAEAALQRFESVLRSEYAEGELREVPGAEATLHRLREAGVKLALGSGFDRGLVELLLDRLGWTNLFDNVTSSTDVMRGRPAPYMIYRAMMELGVEDVARVAVVGDTSLDLRAGHNARAGWVIGVWSGAQDAQTLGQTWHTHLLPSIACVPAVFQVSVQA